MSELRRIVNCAELVQEGCTFLRGRMPAGKMVVSILSSGKELCVHDHNALVSVPGDVDGLSKNIETLWQGSGLYERLALGSPASARRHSKGRRVVYLSGQLTALERWQ